MKAADYQIKSIWQDDIRIGFIARRSAIIGCAQGIPTGWMCSKELIGWWHGNYATRNLAREALKS